MTLIRVTQLNFPGKANPSWDLLDPIAGDYLSILTSLDETLDDVHECCDSGTYIVLVVRDNIVIGRQTISDKAVISWMQDNGGIRVLRDSGRRLTQHLATTAPPLAKAPFAIDAFDTSALPNRPWPNCLCGCARRFARWAHSDALPLNCYSFAVNSLDPSAGVEATPGCNNRRKCERQPCPPKKADDLVRGAECDGLELVTRITWPPPGRMHYAALLIDPDEETSFHWVRLEDNRMWAHKWPGCPPHFCDDLGNLVRFDRRAKRKFGHGGVKDGDYGRFEFKELYLVPRGIIVAGPTRDRLNVT